VFGDRRPYLVAILVLEPDLITRLGLQNGELDRITRAIDAAVARENQSVSPRERVRRFLIASEPFTPSNGLMTPTLKIRRHAIRDAYCAALDALYEHERAGAAD